MEKLFAENGFPRLHTSNVSIEIVLRELCKTVYELENLIAKYDLDIGQKVVRKVYCDLHQKEMEPFGFKMVPFKADRKKENHITPEEMRDFNEVFYGKTNDQVSAIFFVILCMLVQLFILVTLYALFLLM